MIGIVTAGIVVISINSFSNFNIKKDGVGEG